jgi:phosphotransferase system enzyme I (PtsP)
MRHESHSNAPGGWPASTTDAGGELAARSAAEALVSATPSAAPLEGGTSLVSGKGSHRADVSERALSDSKVFAATALSLPHELSLVIQRSNSLAEILDSAVAKIAETLSADVCSIYLLDSASKKLVLRATRGLDAASVGKVAMCLGEGLTGYMVESMCEVVAHEASEHPKFLFFPETGEERFKSYIGVPLAVRNRPVGALVIQRAEGNLGTNEDVQTLWTIAAQLVGVVENARLIEALDRGSEGVGYLNEVRAWHTPQAPSASSSGSDVVLEGSAASPGIAIAEAVIRGAYELRPSDRRTTSLGYEPERTRYLGALERTRDEILKIQKEAEKQADEEHALIFSSHLLLLNDHVLHRRIDDLIKSGVTAPVAVDQALGEFETLLGRVSDPYILDRIEDIRDLRSRILGQLLYAGRLAPTVSDRIVISGGTPPSLVVELKAKSARALVTGFGGATSHGAILARSMGIPAVTGVPDIHRYIRSGDVVIVDGTRGVVVIRPTPTTLERYERMLRAEEARRSGQRKYCDLPARTADGERIVLLANIGVAADLRIARQNGAEGVGLYRTEFPFLIRDSFPTRSEQVRIYKKAYEAFPRESIYFRLLDLGGDKFLPRAGVEVDRNPFHGYRSIRVLFDYPEILRDQVQAFALAAAGRPLRIMIPMISAVDEFLRAKELILSAIRDIPNRAGDVEAKIGVMIEVPAAVEIARNLAQVADFFSIGTNDLIQYTLAVDRENGGVASPLDPFHPAILRMIHRTVADAHREGLEVSVCGEMANNWRLALTMIAFGVDSISVVPAAIPELKQALAGGAIIPLRAQTNAILAQPDGTSVERILEELLPLPGLGS